MDTQRHSRTSRGAQLAHRAPWQRPWEGCVLHDDGKYVNFGRRQVLMLQMALYGSESLLRVL